MRVMSFLDSSGRPRLAVADGDGTPRDVTSSPLVRRGLATGLSPLRSYLATGQPLELLARETADAPEPDIASVLPLVPDPSKIVAAPVNYRDHQQEMSTASAVDGLGVFLKAPSSVLGHGATVRLPYDDRRFDQEGELAVVIGRRASHVSAAEVPSVIAGYSCLLDMTMRGGEDRSVRKSFDTFTPVGPYLVTQDEAGNLRDLELHTWVDDTLRQRADIVDLIWDVPRLLEYISSVMVLEPGDIVATGTPAGVGQVSDGQRIAVEITNLGRLEVSVSATGAVHCPTHGKNAGPVPPAAVTPVTERKLSATGADDDGPCTLGRTVDRRGQRCCGTDRRELALRGWSVSLVPSQSVRWDRDGTWCFSMAGSSPSA